MHQTKSVEVQVDGADEDLGAEDVEQRQRITGRRDRTVRWHALPAHAFSARCRCHETPFAKSRIQCLFQAPQRVLKLRRWSLGLRRWMRGRARQGEPGKGRNLAI